MLRVAVCDDDLEVLEQIKQIFKREYANQMMTIYVSDIEDYVEQLKRSITEEPDIVIMDIRWNKEIDGVDIAVELQKHYPRIKIIFLTGYIQYAVDIFRANPSYFLVKPINGDKLRLALEKTKEAVLREREKRVVFKTKGQVITLDVADILYVESCKHELIVHGIKEDRSLWMKVSDFLSMVDASFIRVHQSYAVNAVYIRKMDAESVELTTKKILPVSRRRYSAAKADFMDYLENAKEISI